VLDDTKFRGGSFYESNVIHEVWQEVGGELVEEFPLPSIAGQHSRNRRIDAVFAVDGPRRRYAAGTPLNLRGRDVVVCQAKAGQLDLGVLGQTLFAAELIQSSEHAPSSVRLIAAAVCPNLSIERLLESYAPLERRIHHRTYPGLMSGGSSGEEVPADVRRKMVAAVHEKFGGRLIEGGKASGRRPHFAHVYVATTGGSLRWADPDAIILQARESEKFAATDTVEVAADEPVTLVYTSYKFYMTTMGRAVFGRQLAQDQLGLTNVRSVFCYRNDNAKLRELLEKLRPDIEVLPG
jgi:hypothetical protein